MVDDDVQAAEDLKWSLIENVLYPRVLPISAICEALRRHGGGG